MKLRIGDMVHYSIPSGPEELTQLAAIVTAIGETDMHAWLEVKYKNGNIFIGNIPFSEEYKGMHWSFRPEI